MQQLTGQKGGKGAGGEIRAAQEDPNTLRSVATARIIDLVSEGEIGGLVQGLRSVFLDGVPVQNADGSFNFQGLMVDERVGTPSQTAVPGFASVEAEQLVDQRLTYGNPIERVITDPDIDAVRPKIVLPALTQQDKDDGDLHGYDVQLAFDVQANGGSWQQVLVDTIRGKTTTEYEKHYRLEKPEGGVPWSFRVRRLSVDTDDDTSIRNETHFSTYTTLIDAKLSYPNSAYYALTIDAEQFGDTVPQRSYEINGLIMQVPSNYTPHTRQYSGLWDGTFKRAWSDNPAWVLYDLITNARYGLGEFIDAARVNKGQLYQIAQYCDEMIADGFGGYEPRWTFNAQIRTQEDAYSLLRKVASVYRGVNYYGSGTVNFVHDAPSDMVQIVAPANVIDGQFSYSSKSLKARYTAVMTTYNNPDDAGRAAIDVWEEANAVAQQGWRKKDITAFACNSRGQARRTGRWEVDDDQSSIKTLRYQCGLDHLYVRPGDVIGVQDPSIAGLRLSGRVKSHAGNTVTLDHLPAQLPEQPYRFRVINTRGEVVERAVNNINTSMHTLILDTDPGELVTGALWVLSAAAVELPLYRVKSVAAQNDNTYSIEAEAYDPNKYDRIEKGIVLDAPDFTLLPEGPLKAPSNLTLSETLYRDGSTLKTRLTVSVTPAADPRAAFVQFQYKLSASSGWQLAQVASDPVMELNGLRDNQQVQCRARTIGRVGRQSQWLESDLYTVLGKLAPPTKPANFTAQIRPESGVLLAKAPSPDVDYAKTIFKEGENYQSATTLFAGAANSFLWDKVAAGNLTFWCEDYDTGGRVSEVVSVNLAVNHPRAPSVTARFERGDLVLSWPPVVSDFAIRYYIVRADAQEIERTATNSARMTVTWQSAKTFTVTPVDIAGNSGSAGSATVNVAAPKMPIVTAEYHGADLKITWSDAVGTLPIKEYIISDGGREIDRVSGLSLLLPVTWSAAKTFGVTPVDLAGQLGTEGTVSVGVAAPVMERVDRVFEGGNIKFTVNYAAGSVPIDRVIIRYASEVIAEVYSRTWSIPVDWVGAKNFQFSAMDVAGAESNKVLVAINPSPPTLPVITGKFVNRAIQLTWSDAAGDLPVARYLVDDDGALTEVTQPNYSAIVERPGVHAITVKAVDSAGNIGPTAAFDVNPVPPSNATLLSEVIDNNVLFRYGATPGSLPIDYFEFKKGPVYEEADPFAVKAGNSTFTTSFESSAGVYPYWLTPVDTAGNRGQYASTTATLSQPPDYILYAKYSEAEQGWLGVFNNALKTQRGTLLVPVNVTETWQQYANNGYSTIQDEMNAGYPVFAQPGPVAGSYENIIDYGTVLKGSLITVSTTPDLLAGSVRTEIRLSFSEDGQQWEAGSVNQMQIFGRNFRYVKLRGDYIGDGNDLIEIEDIQIRLDRKLRSDAGKGQALASDAGGTPVTFTVQFIDIQHISITPMTTQQVIYIVDFQDVPNPSGFKVLFYNSAGQRVDCNFSWGAEGF